ncbi:permease [Candidatus Saccharibacteria bacterium oral taxon 955]|nr:permease [Candidatus Saccharibacteria bacterium oral taxon 955]
MPKQVQDFITLTLGVIIEALPFVMLGLFFSIIVRLWLPHDWLIKYLPKQPFLRRALISLLGVFMPVCECGNVPLARGLLAKGLTPAESLTFLLAAPILNPVTIITTQQAFSDDNTVLIARILGGFLIANLIGWIYSSTRQDAMLRPEFIAICKEKKDNSNRLVDALHFFKHEARSMMPALVIGAMVAGLIQVVVPRETILLLGNSPAWSVLVMAVLAFVVSICSSVDAFFALAFRGSFTSGSLVSFLTFGPMIDVKMLSLMRTTYRRNILLQVSVLVFLMSILIGLVVNYVF